MAEGYPSPIKGFREFFSRLCEGLRTDDVFMMLCKSFEITVLTMGFVNKLPFLAHVQLKQIFVLHIWKTAGLVFTT